MQSPLALCPIIWHSLQIASHSMKSACNWGPLSGEVPCVPLHKFPPGTSESSELHSHPQLSCRPTQGNTGKTPSVASKTLPYPVASPPATWASHCLWEKSTHKVMLTPLRFIIPRNPYQLLRRSRREPHSQMKKPRLRKGVCPAQITQQVTMETRI